MIPVEELQLIPIFQQLTDEELKELRNLVQVQQVHKGIYVVHQGEPGPSLMMILKGKVKISLISEDGKEIVLAHFAQGDFFGEISLLTGTDRSANVVAQTDCTLLVLPSADFHQFLEKSPNFALTLMKALALRLKSASAKIGDLALYDVYQRVWRALYSLAIKENSTFVPQGNEEIPLSVEQRPTHQELAAMVGTSREMVTRALKNLEDDGCIVIEGKKILVRKIPE